LKSTRLVVRKSVDDTDGMRVDSAILVPSTTMHVQNYTCSVMKRIAVAETAPRADARSVCVIRTMVG